MTDAEALWDIRMGDGEAGSAVVEGAIRRLAEVSLADPPRIRLYCDGRLGSPHAYRIREEDDVVVVSGGSELALAYGLGELEQSIWDEAGVRRLHLRHPAVVRQPLASERTLYFNIFDDLAGVLGPDQRDDEGWRRSVDEAIKARFSRIDFYLWPELLMHQEAGLSAGRNRDLHERLQTMMRYAQERGIKVGYWFAPMCLSRHSWQAHPDLHGDAYPSGFTSLCPSRDGSLALAEEVYSLELEWFGEADAFQLWFHDPGGCFCTTCRDDLGAAAFRQVRHFAPLIEQANPSARLEISAWPIWANEAEFGVSYRARFLEELDHFAAEWGRPIGVLDTPVATGHVLDDVRQLGCESIAFYLATNIETGFFLFKPSLQVLDDIRERTEREGPDQVVVMRIEEATKWPQNAFAGAQLWSPGLEVRPLCNYWAGSVGMGGILSRGVSAMQELLSAGAANSVIRLSPVLTGLDTGAGPVPETLRALVASAAIYDALAEAGAGAAASTALKDRAARAMRSSSILDPMTSQLVDRFDQFAGWVARGELAEMY